jgi:hypothetical protein
MESETFTNVVRAQLTTKSHKPCTYFADAVNGDHCFVKGPFESLADARVSNNVSSLKRLFNVDIHTVDSELLELVPDGMPDCQFGIRMSTDLTKKYWFQVVRDVLPGEVRPLPSKQRSSSKAWPKSVSVVDWSKLTRHTHVDYQRQWSKSIYQRQSTAAFLFVEHIFISWICGAGPDLTPTNFIIVDGDTVLQVDNDEYFNNEWWITGTRIGSNKTKAYEQLSRFMEENDKKCQTMLKTFSTKVARHRIEMVELVGTDHWENMSKRATALASNWVTAGTTWSVTPLPLHAKRKRVNSVDSSPKRPRETASAPAPAPVVDVPPVTPLLRQHSIHPGVEPLMTTPSGIFIGQCRPTGTDPWGHLLSGRETDFQRAVRSGDWRRATLCFFVCYNVESIYPDDNAAKDIRRSIVDRLAITLLEDIGVANHHLVSLVMMYCTEYNKIRTTPTSTTDVAKTFATIIYNACVSKKSNIQCHMSHTFDIKNMYNTVGEFGIKWNSNPLSFSDPNYIRVLESDHIKAWDVLEGMVPCVFKSIWYHLGDRGKKAVVCYLFTLLHFVHTYVIKDFNNRSSCGSLTAFPSNLDWRSYIHNLVPMDPIVSDAVCELDNESYQFRNERYKEIYDKSNV